MTCPTISSIILPLTNNPTQKTVSQSQTLSERDYGARNLPPRNVELFGVDNSDPLRPASGFLLQQGHGDDRVLFLPITWSVPIERPISGAADDRYRQSNKIWLKGVRVRFTVVYENAFRIRMAVYKVQTVGANHPFTRAHLGHMPTTGPAQAFVQDWVDMNHASVVEWGPYDHTRINRLQGTGTAPPPAPIWNISSTDGTIFHADLAKGERRPLKTYELWRTGPSGVGSVDVDWFVPIEKWVSYIGEQTATIQDGGFYQVMFYYDCPVVTDPIAPVTIGRIRHISSKVYFR